MSTMDLIRANVKQSRVDEYMGAWAMESTRLYMLRDRFASMDFARHLAEFRLSEQAGERADYGDSSRFGSQTTSSGTLIINMDGTMMKQRSSMGGCSTVATRRILRSAANDDSVKSVLLRIDSPGGTVSGTRDLAMDIAEFGTRKPIDAYIEDLGASAAYWCASQCRKIYANKTALVGSIGTLGVYVDCSEMCSKEGYKVHVVATGKYKGTAVPGAEITPDQLAYLQDLVNGNQKIFDADVAAGRRVTAKKVNEWNDGRVWRADEAVSLGLIDGIQSLDETLNQISKAKPRGARAVSVAVGSTAMFENKPASAAAGEDDPDEEIDDPSELEEEVDDPSELEDEIDGEAKLESTSGRPDATLTEDALMKTENAAGAPAPAPAAAPAAAPVAQATALVSGEALKPQAATLAELKAGCFGASNDFLVAQLEAGATLASAQTAWMAHMASQNAELKTKLEAAEKPGNKANARPGVEPLGAGKPGVSSEEGAITDPITKWNAELSARMEKGMTRRAAIASVEAAHPGLRDAYVAEFNAQNKGKLAAGGAPARS